MIRRKKLSACVNNPVDKRVIALLAQSQGGNADAPGELYDLFVARMQDLKAHALVPTPSVATEINDGGQHESPQTTRMDEHTAAEISWYDLIENIEAAAEHIWRDEFAGDDSNQASRARYQGRSHSAGQVRFQQRRLEVLVAEAHALLILALEARLYRLRMGSNYQFYDVESDASENTVILLRNVLKGYWRQIRGWDRELRQVTGMRYFQTRQVGAERFKAFSKEFGPERVPAKEIGWLTFAPSAGNELRYQYFDALLRDRSAHPSHWGSALWLLLLKVTMGYGNKPMRFVATTFSVVSLFSVLFFISDRYSNGKCYVARFTLSSIFRHIYVAVTNLTSLGSYPTPCGPGAHALLISETVIGYFLFAILAALLIESVREK